MHEISSYKRPIPPMKTRVPKSYREMPGQRIGADLQAFSSESFAPSGRLQLAISCIFRQFVAPKFQTSGYRHRFATPDPPKAVARIRYQLLKRPPFGVAARLPWVAMREPLSGLFIGFETKALRIGV